MNNYLFFDSASTTKCSEAAIQLIQRYAGEDFGNPASTHVYGQKSARAIRDARLFFAEVFKVEPEQVIFTGSGTEANNLAISGIALAAHLNRPSEKPPVTVLTSSTEHPSVRKTVESLNAFGIDTQTVPVDRTGQLNREKFWALLTASTAVLSLHQINNIVGTVLPIEEIARLAKEKVPHLIVHTDAVQAFGKITVPKSTSSIDLISLSAHKIQGPKGVGALIVLNKKLLSNKLRPLIWGGDQEGGFRSGTQNAGLIAAFHIAAALALKNREQNFAHVSQLRDHLKELLMSKHSGPDVAGQNPDPTTAEFAGSVVRWNSPADASPYIVSLSVPGFPAGPLAKLLEERGCLVSVGSACTAKKPQPDPVLGAMRLPTELHTSTIRVSFSADLVLSDIDRLAQALLESIQLMNKLLGGSPTRSSGKGVGKSSGKAPRER
jgi:cysteine desulfurase